MKFSMDNSFFLSYREEKEKNALYITFHLQQEII